MNALDPAPSRRSAGVVGAGDLLAGLAAVVLVRRLAAGVAAGAGLEIAAIRGPKEDDAEEQRDDRGEDGDRQRGRKAGHDPGEDVAAGAGLDGPGYRFRIVETATATSLGEDFAGYLDKVDAGALLAAADAVVLPFREGGGEWNTSIHGAVDNGAPVITTSRRPRADDVESGIRYRPSEDVSAMREALRLSHRKARPAATASNDWPSIAARHLEIYAEALGRSPAAAAR